jgi:hypothetical protein
LGAIFFLTYLLAVVLSLTLCVGTTACEMTVVGDAWPWFLFFPQNNSLLYLSVAANLFFYYFLGVGIGGSYRKGGKWRVIYYAQIVLVVLSAVAHGVILKVWSRVGY